MKLSEIAQNDYVKLLVYGQSGAGKTCLAASFPGPIKYFDFDDKVSSAAKFFANDKEKLDSIDVFQGAREAREFRMVKFLKEFREIAALANAKKPLPFKTLVIDSLTTLSYYMLEDYIHVSQRGIKRAFADINAMQDYQFLDKHLTQIISGLLTLDCNVVFVGHLAIDKDELTGQILRKPLMAGKFADKLPIYFEEVYVAKVDGTGKYTLQTKSDNTFPVIRSQRNLAKEIPSSYASIINK